MFWPDDPNNETSGEGAKSPGEVLDIKGHRREDVRESQHWIELGKVTEDEDESDGIIVSGGDVIASRKREKRSSKEMCGLM